MYNINAMATGARTRFGRAFERVLSGFENFSEIVILCVGTDRITGDCLGPLTGYKLVPLLKLKGTPPTFLYGTLEHPAHALNLDNFVREIYINHPAPLLVVIDASLGLPQHIGRLSIRSGGVAPGSGVGKKMPVIGDISVTGVVNGVTRQEFAVLQNTRLNTVMKMAEVAAAGIIHGLRASKYVL